MTINAEQYIEMMRRKFVPALRRKRGIDMNIGVPVLEFLRQYFPRDGLILHQTDNPWPPNSPNLNPSDYFLWGYLKDRVYENNPQTTEVLKDNIRIEIRQIPQEMLNGFVDNFNVRVAAVIQQWGAWIEHTINY